MPRLIHLLVPFLFLAAIATARPPTDRTNEAFKLFINEFVKITPGQGNFPVSSLRGSAAGPIEEQPAQEVKIASPFALAKYEVTQELYEVVIGKNPSRWKGSRNSVEMVNWNEASEFCVKATGQLRDHKMLAADEEIRLPTEAEWEYACRAGTTTQFSFGDDVKQLGDFAWFTGNAKGNDPPVGQKKPNAWGLYDTHGYVWEWCQDSWHPNYQGAPADGSAWEEKDAKERVVRGGSWADEADKARSAYRHHLPVGTRDQAVGFRCVKAKARS